MSKKQEMWANSIFYERTIGKSDLYRNIQMLDTTRSLLVFGDEAHLLNEQDVTVTRNPSTAYYEEKEDENHQIKRDTVFLCADTLKYISLKNPAFYGTDTSKTDTAILQQTDTTAMGGRGTPLPPTATADSLLPPADLTPPRPMPFTGIMVLDSLQRDLRRLRAEIPKKTPSPVYSAMFARKPAADTSDGGTPPPVIDSVLQYFYAYRAVKIYRNDGQAVCDSMVFFVNDTLTEMFYNPVLWNTNHQISADKMRFISKDSVLYRGEFLGSALMISEEDTVHYNQIKSRDMHAYFKDNEIYLMDVIANVQTIFFNEEDSVLVDINFAESANMKIFIKNRQVARVKYLTDLKNDLHPLDDVPREKQRLKGFAWHDALRPKTRYDVCNRHIRPSQRAAVSTITKPTFPITRKIDAVK